MSTADDDKKRDVSPLDFFKPSTEYASKQQAIERLNICNECPSLKLKMCEHCGCFMPAKTKLAAASCPLGKW